jgi:hypothetical protein
MLLSEELAKLKMNSQTRVDQNANVQIDVLGHCVWFRLDLNNRRWHSLEAPEEAAFPSR